MRISKLVAIAGLAALPFVGGTAASAATFTIFDNPGGQVLLPNVNIANFSTFSQSLTPGDSVSVTYESEVGDNTLFAGVGFDFSPLGAKQAYEVVFTGTDFADFGVTNVHLSSSASLADVFDSATITGKGQLVSLMGVSPTSPFYVLYEFAKPGPGSFTGDLTLAAIPLPAGGVLLLGALGGLAAMRRRAKKA